MAEIVFEEKQVSKKLTASALQLTLIISLIITIILGSLIYLYSFYRQQDSKIQHQDRLLNLITSGFELSKSVYLSPSDTVWADVLYAGDSLRVQKENWGLYDKVTLTAIYQHDSIKRAFLLGLESIDSTVLYVSDEDRNLSVSGRTTIIGTAYLPQAGIKPAFVDGKFFDGKEEIIEGKKKFSERALPAIDKQRLQPLTEGLDSSTFLSPSMLQFSQHFRSFKEPTQYVYSEAALWLSNQAIEGNIMLSSDTLIHITADCTLEHIICIAPTIRVDKGFRGSVQLFATDSLIVGDEVHLSYPSALVLFAEDEEFRRALKIGKDGSIAGSVLLYEEKRSSVPHMLSLGENSLVTGELIAFGMLKYTKPLTVRGSTYCYRFITQTPSSLYENFLIDINLDRSARHPFFLQSYAWQKEEKNVPNSILTWLE
ncbi:hypothetical protein FAZ15_21350 [Sphingobacterium olei]|uniref:Uncharacterized protein n=1 Tax=Sphingobacterium olei TaxID=2571155 RepID=A0A4U0N9R0_9SPHI|nr:hypothetical protein [Sphingobacterium olei]TJZ50570.1 hypothetical protein FAZ15_21350 [Sphingobacterium olei]